MKKEDAIKVITECAKIYNTNLENKNVMFIFGSSAQKLSAFESLFLPKHFLHLTGVDIAASNTINSSSQFYESCLNSKLSPNDFTLSLNGTTDMKLAILPQIMNIHKLAKMVGDYNFSKSLLYTDKLAGGITACLGFIREDEYYIPNTALNEDIRDITINPQKRVFAILKKSVTEPYYTQLCYTAKGVDFKDLTLPTSIISKLNISPYNSPEVSKRGIKEYIAAAQEAAAAQERNRSPKKSHNKIR